ncbi:helix-turn-helix domain-containing protein [Nonomuraea sp. MTCD27]|uniref:helix-turn-helix domain-containing protein n=1 Tax=Nonomuraea sp. MTCD27 TaxID=1676747 RepID=UPI0035C1AD0E
MSQGATIRLRDGVDEQLKEVFGYKTATEVAEALGVDQGQYSRVIRGRSDPGPQFQARLLLRVQQYGLTFDDLFHVVEIDAALEESA